MKTGVVLAQSRIDSKQLDSGGQLKPCTAPQCGGFTLEAELGIAKNSSGEVLAHGHHLGWEVKQFAVEDFERIESAKPITMMTPEPDGGFYKDADVASFIRKFGDADKNDKPDRLNFGRRGARLCEPQHFRYERDNGDFPHQRNSEAAAGVRSRCSLLRSGHQAGKRVHGQSKVQEAQPVSRGV